MMYRFDKCVKLGMMSWLVSFLTYMELPLEVGSLFIQVINQNTIIKLISYTWLLCAYSCVYIVFCVCVCVRAQHKSSVHLMAHVPHASARVLSPEAGRPDAALHPGGEHIQPLVCAVGLGRGHTLQRPGETHSHLLQKADSARLCLDSFGIICGPL